MKSLNRQYVLMGLSNPNWGVKRISLKIAAGCMVVFAVDIRRRMMELRSTSLHCGRRIQLRQRCNPINGMGSAHVPAGTLLALGC
ncbi:hypothetical protein ASB65_14745 [Agrobacterium tumefaciens str. B6]|nr:hypothetical protein ASB65_14745 [Agrobacterium tumefaciens str. B6]OCJ28041.1 hypothetical protein A6U90_16335 [Agrobacterium tumefaciens]